MSNMPFTEATVEAAALAWFAELGYGVLSGLDIAPGEPLAERESYGDVVLVGRLREALQRINPHVPSEAREEALRKVTRAESPSLVVANRRFHRLLTEGVDVEYHAADGRIVHDKVWLVDWRWPARNDWLAVNQFTIVEHKRE